MKDQIRRFFEAQTDLERGAQELSAPPAARTVPDATETHRVRDVDDVNMCRSFSEWLCLWWKEHGIGRGRHD